MSLRRFFRRARWDRERSEELEIHLRIETEENLDRGLPYHEARAAALRKLGNRTSIREEIYRMNAMTFLDTLAGVRYDGYQSVVYPGLPVVRYFPSREITPARLYESGNSTLWAANEVLTPFDPSRGSFGPPLNPRPGPARPGTDAISAIHESPDGSLWIGTVRRAWNRTDLFWSRDSPTCSFLSSKMMRKMQPRCGSFSYAPVCRCESRKTGRWVLMSSANGILA